MPPQGKGPLYLRPLLMGSGPILGLAPAPEYTFLIYAAPVGNYFKVSARTGRSRSSRPGDARDVNNHRAWRSCLFFFQEGLAPINLVVDDEFHRAMPGGTGGVKTIANYAPVRSLVGGVQLRWPLAILPRTVRGG